MRTLVLAWWIMKGRYSLWNIIKDRVTGKPNYAIKSTGSGQYVYVLHDPFSGKPFYVGRSNNPGRRYFEHVNERDSTKKSEYIENLLKHGCVPYMTIVQVCGKDDIEQVEEQWIRYFDRRHKLVNMIYSSRRRK